MTESPLISVVIPAYNHERFIGAAIDSVLHQSCDDFELIIVDDGSTDNTAQVIKSYSDDRLHYYYQDNQDAYNTINRGIECARGTYISILNSDDVYETQRLEQLLTICRDKNAVCAFTDVVPISDDGDIFTDQGFGWNIWHQSNRDCYFESKDLYTAFLNGNFMVTTSNLFMTSDAARTVGPFAPLRYLHDYDFIFRMLLAFPDKVHYAADLKLLQYRIHSGNTLGEAAIIGREQDQELIRKYLLAVIPPELQSYVSTGSNRLVTLEQELCRVKRQLNPSETQGVKGALCALKSAVKTWVGKKLS